MKRHKPKPNPWRGAFAEIDARKRETEKGEKTMPLEETVELICREIYGRSLDELTPEECGELLRRIKNAFGRDDGDA